MTLWPLAVIGVAWYVWSGYNEPLVPGQQSFTLYYWNKCGHCQKMMPTFNKLGSMIGDVKIRKVEASENVEKNISAYPTMVFRGKDGKETVYDGERSYDAIRTFILSSSQ
jgi:thiol-disulfide isomerase/thioredoxin